MVAEATMVDVGRPPLVARMSRVTGGFTPEQPAQNRLMSMRGTGPVAVGMKVWPIHCVVVTPKPLLLSDVFCWLMVGALTSVTLPGDDVRSTLLGIPPKKSACVVSVKQ